MLQLGTVGVRPKGGRLWLIAPLVPERLPKSWEYWIPCPRKLSVERKGIAEELYVFCSENTSSEKTGGFLLVWSSWNLLLPGPCPTSFDSDFKLGNVCLIQSQAPFSAALGPVFCDLVEG